MLLQLLMEMILVLRLLQELRKLVQFMMGMLRMKDHVRLCSAAPGIYAGNNKVIPSLVPVVLLPLGGGKLSNISGRLNMIDS
jgi:hypothetical protein